MRQQAIVREKTMTRKINLWVLTSVLLAAVPPTQAQQAMPKIARIGVLANGPVFLARFKAFQEGLRALGYVEGINIIYEYRNAESKIDRLSALAAQLVQAEVDVIYTASADGVAAAKRATQTIPIVFGTVQDPVASGLVASLARPGGNVTGMSALAVDLNGKRLELLREVAPRVTRIAFLWSPIHGAQAILKDAQAAAQGLKVQLISLEVREHRDLDGMLDSAMKQRPNALSTVPDPVINNARGPIVGFAAKNRLPAMYAAPEFVEGGGLMSYAPNYADLWRRSASHVDKILKGTKPADIPVEQPMRFEFIVNLKTAKQIGLTIPPNVLVRADRVIR